MTRVNFQIRLALVLYGGISLAVYMNGMAQELLALVRASQARRMAEADPDHPYVQEQRATNAYVRLLDAAGVDVVIDVIAGTSAGGLNGLILAKALAVGAPDLSAMTAVWKEQAQIYKLGTFDREPSALLSGQFLFTQLEKVLQQLSRSAMPALARQVEVLDCFVTATDVRGHRWTWRDGFHEKVQGLAHKFLFHLRKRTCDAETGRSYDQNDFAAPDRDRQALIDRVLAKVGQATAALPPAFPPVRIGREEVEAAGLSLLAGMEPPPEGTWFSDGGVLMNRPFEPVVQTVAQRHTTVPYKRVLAFLEAAPEPVEAPLQTEPSLVENAIAGLTLTMRQDIADDLERLSRENQHRRALLDLVERMDEAASQVTAPWSLVEEAAREALSQVAAAGGARVIPFPPSLGAESPVLQSYYALRLLRVRQTFRRMLEEALEGLELTGPRREVALEALLAEADWLQSERPAPGPAVSGLLARYDMEYQQRRLHFLITRVQRQYRPGASPSDMGAMTTLLGGLWGALEDWRNAGWMLSHAGRLGVQPTPWGEEARRLDQAFLALKQVAHAPGEPAARLADLKQAAGAAMTAVDQFLARVGDRTAAEASRALAAAREALPLRSSQTGEPLRPPGSREELTADRLLRSYEQFESRDLILFPLRTYGATGEWEEVELMRLGAEGAQGWVRRSAGEKLTGTRLNYFGAFLDERWRANDIMWGRLDAAEQLTRLVVTESGLLKRDAAGEPGGEAPPERAYAGEARQALADRRRQIVNDFPELVDMEQVKASLRQSGATLEEEGRVPDWALQRYMQDRYRITPDGVEGLPPERLAGEVLILLHNLVTALERSGSARSMGGLQRVLLTVLRPLNWVARLILIPREGLLGVVQGNAASLMTVVGAALLLLHLFHAVHLETAGWGVILALLAPAILDSLFRPTPLRLAVTGLLAATSGGAALAQASLPDWAAWLEPLQQVLIVALPAWVYRFAAGWGFFAGIFGALAAAYAAGRRK